jgi:nitrogen fixation NifU-like protein
MQLNELYREVILDHNKHPRNHGRLDPADALANGHNPLCGDRLTVTLRMDGDTISDLKVDGNGCAISVASGSLMTEAVKGKDRAAVGALFDRVHALLTLPEASADGLGKLAALSGVREFPARVKCASLCWHTLNAALSQLGQPAAESHGTAAISTE